MPDPTTAFDSSSPAAGSSSPAMVADPRCRVLLVDDDRLLRSHLSAILVAAHYAVDTAASGREALGILESAHYDVLLTDWHMPDIDGAALCRRIRLHSATGHLYVLMLTICDSELDILTGLAAGADDYLVKGSPVDQLLARLEIGRRGRPARANAFSGWS